MAIQRLTLTATPTGKDLAQAAINLAGLQEQVAESSWVPYPSPENPKLYWVSGSMETDLFDQLVLVLTSLLGVRVRTGQLRPSSPALTMAQAQTNFPVPNVGPPFATVVTIKCAKWLHYRDFGLLALGGFDDDGAPG